MVKTLKFGSRGERHGDTNTYNNYLPKNKTPFGKKKRGLIIRFGDANASEFSKGESQVYMEAGVLKCS